MPYAVYIPMASLAAILVIVAYNMSEWKTFLYLTKGHRADVAVLLITFFLTVVIDLTVAIEVGVVLAIILFVKRVSETSSITQLDTDSIAATENPEMADDSEMLDVPKSIEIYEIDGPFFFGLASKLDEMDSASHHMVNVRIIRMRKVPFIDSTGLNNLRNLWKRSKKENIQIVLSGVSNEVFGALEKAGFVDELGRQNIYDHIIPALEKAKEIDSVLIAEHKKKHKHAV
ncbi:C4-dicarboxylic acid transporter DauA [bioreactor metagenome]|uniref:C4-dicarboxylic acid transporter DauA n=1 Tax=bioreactor metagenome TaxID=1076179 RepID=A0A645EED2_9ZZZZ